MNNQDPQKHPRSTKDVSGTTVDFYLRQNKEGKLNIHKRKEKNNMTNLKDLRQLFLITLTGRV